MIWPSRASCQRIPRTPRASSFSTAVCPGASGGVASAMRRVSMLARRASRGSGSETRSRRPSEHVLVHAAPPAPSPRRTGMRRQSTVQECGSSSTGAIGTSVRPGRRPDASSTLSLIASPCTSATVPTTSRLSAGYGAITTSERHNACSEKEAPDIEGRVAIYVCPECADLDDLDCGALTTLVTREGDDIVWREVAFSYPFYGTWRHDPITGWEELRFPAGDTGGLSPSVHGRRLRRTRRAYSRRGTGAGAEPPRL